MKMRAVKEESEQMRKLL